MAFFKRRTFTASGRSWGILVLGVWLILEGLVPLLNVRFMGLAMIQSALAILAGVLLLIGR